MGQAPQPLPAFLTSLYRLFLRTSSAAVLHKPPAVWTTRELWRPVFEDAARVSHQLQDSTLPESQRGSLEGWMDTWNNKMDNTLSFLYSSSQSRGTPHSITKNLSHLLWAHGEFVENRFFSIRGRWRPQLAPDDPAYKIRTKSKEIKQQQKREFDDKAWNALGEVIGLAEGHHSLFLGRVTAKRRKKVARPRLRRFETGFQ